jgi:hypothetical protein
VSTTKRSLAPFLEGQIKLPDYERWLARKAASHLKRDRKRGYEGVTGAAYRDAIHQAVAQSKGRDTYTGEELHWNLLSRYDNEDSQRGRHVYKAGFARLPTVDHIDSSVKNSGFCICAWQTNDAKNDLSHQDFLELCKKVLLHEGYKVHKEPEPAA